MATAVLSGQPVLTVHVTNVGQIVEELEINRRVVSLNPHELKIKIRNTKMTKGIYIYIQNTYMSVYVCIMYLMDLNGIHFKNHFI